MRLLRVPFLRLLTAWHRYRHPDQLLRLEDWLAQGRPPESILVFSNTALGDTILSTPALCALRQCFPEARISLFLHRNLMPLFRDHPCADRLIPFHGGFRRFRRTLKALRETRPDVALLLHSNAPQDIPMAYLAGARVILKTPTRSPFRHLLSAQMQPRNDHEARRRMDLVRALGCQAEMPPLRLPNRFVRRPRSELRIGIQAGAADHYKMWPPERFAAVIKRLSGNHPEAHFILTGSRSERPLCAHIEQLASPAPVINRCGNTTIEQLVELVAGLDLLITNDTGTLHVAAALDVPTVSLFSPTSCQEFGPLGPKGLHRVIQKPPPDDLHLPKPRRSNQGMRQIQVEEVVAAALECLHATRQADRLESPLSTGEP